MVAFVIDDNNYKDPKFGIVDRNGDHLYHGGDPRNFAAAPVGSYTGVPAFDDKLLIPRDQWRERLKEKKAKKIGLYNILKKCGPSGRMMPSTNQKQSNYCWAHSSAGVMELVRGIMGLPYIQLSPFSVACQVKNFQNVGGWCQQSLAWIVNNGIASVDTWALCDWSKSNVNPAMKADAARFRGSEWMDFTDNSREEMKNQLVSCLLQDIPVITDYNWWGHSVYAFELFDILDNWDLDVYHRNSWGETYGDAGVFRLKGSKAVPNNAAALRTAFATDPAVHNTPIAI